MLVTRRELKRPHGSQTEGETKESERVLGECQAMAEDKSWSSWNQVKEQAQKINQGDWKKPISGVNREEWEVRQNFANNVAILGYCSFDFDDGA